MLSLLHARTTTFPHHVQLEPTDRFWRDNPSCGISKGQRVKRTLDDARSALDTAFGTGHGGRVFLPVYLKAVAGTHLLARASSLAFVCIQPDSQQPVAL
jgi:hypothetical protein